MSGELGNAGHLLELLNLTEPHFEARTDRNSLAGSRSGFLVRFCGLGRLFDQRPAIESRLGLGGASGEEQQEKPEGLLALAAGGFKEATQDAVVFQPSN